MGRSRLRPRGRHRTIRIPAGAAVIRFRAAAWRVGEPKADAPLDVVLEAAGRQYLARRVRVGGKWTNAATILPPAEGGLREYEWPVDRHAGKRVRIALVDQDARPGCHLSCSGFEVLTPDDLNARAFADAMLALEEKGQPRARRADSRHFMAFSTADRAFTEARLDDGELIHATFFKHFRRKGFAVHEPAEKLMVAVFATQKGFEAYLGRSFGPAATGVYHTPTNRLVVYDYATNPWFLTTKRGADDITRRATTDLERRGKGVALDRMLRDRRDDVNVGTLMHEVAHQLSFNAGLLDRAGDVPAWLAEGLAVYCEATSSGAWQGIGEPNPLRAAALRGQRVRLRHLVESDDWLRKADRVEDVLVGYSASWLLFRLLIDERPRQLKAYLETISSRRAEGHRLADFVGAFGDFKKLEKRYDEYVADTVRREAR